MFKDPEPMPKSLQVYKIIEFLKSKSIDPQTVDVESLVDSKLTYPVNLCIVVRSARIKMSDNNIDPSRIRDFEQQAMIHFKEMYGEDAYQQWEAAKKAAKYASLDIMAEQIRGQYFYKKPTLTNIRLTNVYELRTVMHLLKKMLKFFQESGFRDYCIHKYGLYLFINGLKEYRISRLMQIRECIGLYFSDPRRNIDITFDLASNLLRGPSKADKHLSWSKQQKELIISLKGQTGLNETTISKCCLIYSLNSHFKTDAKIRKYENAHYYVSDRGMISTIRMSMQNFRDSIMDYFFKILPVLKEELRLKQLDPNADPDNIRLKIQTIQEIEKVLNPFEDFIRDDPDDADQISAIVDADKGTGADTDKGTDADTDADKGTGIDADKNAGDTDNIF